MKKISETEIRDGPHDGCRPFKKDLTTSRIVVKHTQLGVTLAEVSLFQN